MVDNVKATLEKDTDPIIQVMAFGVQEALNGGRKATNYNDLVSKMRYIYKIEILCYMKKMSVYVNNQSTVSDIIDQVIWAQGLKNREEYSFFGELLNRGLLLIGRRIRMNLLIADGNPFSRFFVRGRLSRLTKDEKAVNQETNSSYFLAQHRYLKSIHNLEDAIVTQLCLLQMIAEGKKTCLANTDEIFDTISMYIPPKV